MSSALEITPFQYKPLLEPDAFRLLLLHPTHAPTAQVECILQHSTLSLCDHEIIDHYTALSYVWASPLPPRPILVSSRSMTITASLDAALRDLRDATRVVRVWADALCIDQQNVEERNRQVALMGRIYATALHTVIYLGPLTLAAEKVLRATPSRSSGGAGVDVMKAAEEGLLERAWFGRVWVFQELVLSRDPWVQCGGLRVRWTDLCDLLLEGEGKRKRKGLSLLSEMHFARVGRAQTDLFHLLISRRGLGATDARDMVFAHLGVASDGDSIVAGGGLKVDYRQSVERLYEDVARYFIDTTGPETVFFAADNADHSPHFPGLASWAPDWRLKQSSAAPMYRDNRMNVVNLEPKMHYQFIQEPPVLAHIGYEVDVISSVSLSIHRYSQQDSPSRKGYQKAVEDLRAVYASVGGSYASGDENGQYTRWPWELKAAEHQELYLRLSSEWLEIMDKDLPRLSPPATAEELDSHKKFQKEFEDWLVMRAAQGIIAVGGDSEGMESLMYTHLYPTRPESVLNGRRLACMNSKRAGVVPIQARKGDIVVYLAGMPISVVLRPTACAEPGNVKKKIYVAFLKTHRKILESKSPYRKAFEGLTKAGGKDIEHAALIGECYVEGVIGWSFKERLKHHDFNIYALH